MPTYVYKCDNCENIEELEFKMTEDKPKTIKCKKCKNRMHRHYGNSTITIPNTFNNDSTSGINFDKRPSGRKQFF